MLTNTELIRRDLAGKDLDLLEREPHHDYRTQSQDSRPAQNQAGGKAKKKTKAASPATAQ